MNLINRLNRQFVYLKPGNTLSAQASTAMLASGWLGGQFARWVDNGSGELCLDIADGRWVGYLPVGSAEVGDKWVSMSTAARTYGVVTLMYDSCLFYTSTYETIGYIERHGGAPAPLTYTSQCPLYISENGKITTEDESDLVTYGAHNFPSGTAVSQGQFNSIGVCSVPPGTATNQYLGVHFGL